MRQEELERENAELRAQLGLKQQNEPSAWASALTQNVRDELAARALFRHMGNVYIALRDLGFYDVDPKKPRPEDVQLAQSIFDTPGVRAILERDLDDLEKNRVAIIRRQTEIALFSDDVEASQRAAAFCARVAGWQKSTDSGQPGAPINVNVLLGTAAPVTARAAIEAEQVERVAIGTGGFLGHEPGAPVKVHSEALDERDE